MVFIVAVNYEPDKFRTMLVKRLEGRGNVIVLAYRPSGDYPEPSSEHRPLFEGIMILTTPGAFETIGEVAEFVRNYLRTHTAVRTSRSPQTG